MEKNDKTKLKTPFNVMQIMMKHDIDKNFVLNDN